MVIGVQLGNGRYTDIVYVGCAKDGTNDDVVDAVYNGGIVGIDMVGRIVVGEGEDRKEGLYDGNGVAGKEDGR